MADLHVIEELQTYLIGQGIGQFASATPSLTVPSIWLQPRDGAPLPRGNKTTGVVLEHVTIALIDTQIAAPHELEAYLDETYVDIIVRSHQPPDGKLIHRRVRDLLVPIGSFMGRKLWMMNNLLVESSTIWRPEQPLPWPPDGRNIDTYDRVAAYRFVSRRKALAGLPYVP